MKKAIPLICFLVCFVFCFQAHGHDFAQLHIVDVGQGSAALLKFRVWHALECAYCPLGHTGWYVDVCDELSRGVKINMNTPKFATL